MTFKADRVFVLSDGEVSYRFKLSRLDTDAAREGNRIVSDKHSTKELLRTAGVSTPAGRSFTTDFDRGAIRSAARELGYPVALKANNWSKGRGVYSKIQNDADFNYYLDSLIDDLQCRHLLVEEHVPGDDYRYYVVGDKVVGAIQRVRAHVVGDGHSTVGDLISAKNALRRENPYLRNAPIKIDSEVRQLLSQIGKDLNETPAVGEIVYLREKSNASAGGDSIDCTDSVSEKSKRLAIAAIHALPGICHGGVDLLVSDMGGPHERSVVIEINSAAEIGLHLFPAVGAPRDPASELVSYLYPKAVPVQPHSRSWYFRHDEIQAFLKRGIAESVTAPPVPALPASKWVEVTYTGGVEDVAFRRWLAGKYAAARVHGVVFRRSDGTVVAKLCGTEKRIQLAIDERVTLPNHAKIDAVTVHEIDPFPIAPGVRVC